MRRNPVGIPVVYGGEDVKHDPHSLFRFAEPDVFLPIVTLEELYNNKKGGRNGLGGAVIDPKNSSRQ